jgi:hypothetical protein
MVDTLAYVPCLKLDQVRQKCNGYPGTSDMDNRNISGKPLFCQSLSRHLAIGCDMSIMSVTIAARKGPIPDHDSRQRHGRAKTAQGDGSGHAPAH